MASLTVVSVLLDELQPYPENPRDNRAAVQAVKESILQFGFRVPVVIDSQRVIVAGHTRVEAMKELRRENPGNAEYESVPVVIADDLTEDQVRAFRLVDNKVASLATWDFDKLSGEVSALVDTGLNLVPFGWTQEEIDCLHNVVSADCLSEPAGGRQDGVNGAADQGSSLASHRDQQSVRISIADLAFYVLREDYDQWADQLRRDHNYDLDHMLDWLAERMGLLAAKRRRTQLLAQGRAAETGEEVFDGDQPGDPA
jgi:hypothetical protein